MITVLWGAHKDAYQAQRQAFGSEATSDQSIIYHTSFGIKPPDIPKYI